VECRRFRWPVFAFTLALVALLGACGGDDAAPAATLTPSATTDAGAAPRAFQLGVSSLPVEASEAAYAKAFALAGQLGEVVLIQRAPPWADFVPGGSISPRTERLTRIERDLARQNDLRLLLAIDPTSPSDRGQLAGLPPSLVGRDFSDKDVRASFIAYSKYMALNYKPAYMAIGVEVDLFYARRGSAAFRNFVSLYFEAYDAVKEVSPNTLVFATFQYENLLGILGGGPPEQPAWSLVDSFQPKLDLLAISTFPGSSFENLGDMPSGFYDELADHGDKPVVFFSAGWASQEAGGDDDTSQFAYLYRLFAAADSLRSPFLIWFVARDPEVSPDDGLGPLARMGLYDASGKPKDALRVWNSNLSRPLR